MACGMCGYWQQPEYGTPRDPYILYGECHLPFGAAHNEMIMVDGFIDSPPFVNVEPVLLTHPLGHCALYVMLKNQPEC